MILSNVFSKIYSKKKSEDMCDPIPIRKMPPLISENAFLLVCQNRATLSDKGQAFPPDSLATGDCLRYSSDPVKSAAEAQQEALLQSIIMGLSREEMDWYMEWCRGSKAKSADYLKIIIENRIKLGLIQEDDPDCHVLGHDGFKEYERANRS
jgi:hypothetical protein